MKGNNPSRDFSKNAGNTSTPVTYRNPAAVYRSLTVVPGQLEVSRSHISEGNQFAPLVGPLSKQHGQVVWTEAKHDAKPSSSGFEKKDARPVPIPIIVANAPQNSLFLNNQPLNKVVSTISSLLEHNNVDADFNETKFKWTCACYDRHVETRFVCRLFSVPDKTDYYVLDFQRLCGDPFHFQSVYKAIHFKLLKSGFVIQCNASKSMPEPEMRTFKPLSLPPDFFSGGDEAVVEEKETSDYEPICNMCTSPYIDVQREGLSALANYLEQSEFARRCLIGFAKNLIETVSLSRDTQVRRLAAAALASLSCEKDAQSCLKETGSVNVLADLLSDENEVMETRRHAGRILLNILDGNSDIKSIIGQTLIAKSSQNTRLSQIVRDLQSRVTA